jgi:hypothetical protein
MLNADKAKRELNQTFLGAALRANLVLVRFLAPNIVRLSIASKLDFKFIVHIFFFSDKRIMKLNFS